MLTRWSQLVPKTQPTSEDTKHHLKEERRKWSKRASDTNALKLGQGLDGSVCVCVCVYASSVCVCFAMLCMKMFVNV